VDRRRLRKDSPVKAVAHAYKKIAEENQRVSKEAHRQLLRNLSAGMELEGVGTWIDLHRAMFPDAPIPARCPWGMENPPPGWSYANLQRMAGLTEFERKASRQGLGAASDCILPVLHTRVGLLPGQWMQFDDMWIDLKAMFAGQKEPIRPLEFACYDVHSACKIAWGIRPRTEREDGTKTGLKEVEFRFLLAHVLCDVGFHREGVTLVVEHGTAAIREPLERKLAAFSNGAIKVERSGIVGEQVHAGMFPGRARGNPKFKALIECSHGISHNLAAALPAQTGNCPAAAPEQLAGLDAYCRSLVKAAAELPAERRDQLLFPALSFSRMVSLVGEIYDRMNARTWHDLEGWEECGYLVEEFRLGDDANWMPKESLLAMPPNKRLAVAAYLEGHPELMRLRKLSPRDVWARGKKDLARLPMCHLPDILGPEAARRVRVEANGTIAFQDIYLGPGKHIYTARIATPDGFAQSLRRDASYAAFATPYHPEHLWIVDPDSGALIGYAPRYDRAAYGDEAALHRLLGQQRSDLAEQSAPVRERHADAAQERAALVAHNRAVLDGDSAQPAATPEAAHVRKTSGTLADLIPHSEADVETPESDCEQVRAEFDGMFGP
jgi:hypothetical protein